MNIADLHKIANTPTPTHIDDFGRTVADCFYGKKDCNRWHCHSCGRHIVDISWGKYEPTSCPPGEGCQKDLKL